MFLNKVSKQCCSCGACEVTVDDASLPSLVERRGGGDAVAEAFDTPCCPVG